MEGGGKQKNKTKSKTPGMVRVHDHDATLGCGATTLASGEKLLRHAHGVAVGQVVRHARVASEGEEKQRMRRK